MSEDRRRKGVAAVETARKKTACSRDCQKVNIMKRSVKYELFVVQEIRRMSGL